MKQPILLIIYLLLCCIIADSYADVLFNDIYRTYPKEHFLVGIGEVSSSGNSIQDRRVAETLARLEIARQVKVRVSEETVDVKCESSSLRLFDNVHECKNEFRMVIETTVDEFLRGSKIIDKGEKKDIVYAVAIMPKDKIVDDIEKNLKISLKKTRQNLDRVKQGDNQFIRDAQEAYLRAVAYEKEREIILGIKDRSADIFDELEQELVGLKTSKRDQ